MDNNKPEWLKKKISIKDNMEIKSKLAGFKLHTICEEALCPNISECFRKKTATFLIMGDVCTRGCLFCNVKKGKPGPLSQEEPEMIAEMIRELGLKYAVITSVTRDDLADGGAGYFAQTITAVKKLNPLTKIEVLIPDFNGDFEPVKTVASARPDVMGHNIETVKNNYPLIGRSPDRYEISLNAIENIKKADSTIHSKSGLMLGLGEKEEEVIRALCDLGKAGCEFLSIGQYLSPSKSHYPVKEYVTPETFEKYKNLALDAGLIKIKSSPYVRSSYLAEEYL